MTTLRERIDVERFWDSVHRGRDRECWTWKKGTAGGYGVFHALGTRFRAHRVAYELSTGIAPGELCVLHKCDNPPCCNPAHLSVGTHTDNMRDMASKGRGVFLRGEDCSLAKITSADVAWMRFARAYSGATYAAIAKVYGHSKTGTSQAIRGSHSWRRPLSLPSEELS